MNLRCLLSTIVLLMASMGLLAAVPADEPGGPDGPDKRPSAMSFGNDVVPFLARHCYACHGGGKSKGDLTLDKYRDEQAILRDRDVWEKVVEMVHTGEMPPKAKGRARPAPNEVELATRTIDDILEHFDCTGARDDGRVTIRRLNRVEYNNTIRDLVGIDFKPAADFPNDDVGYGFDNIGDVLSVSPLLLERYLHAAEAILEQAIVINDPPRPSKERVGGLRASFGAGANRRGGGVFLHGKGQISGQIYVEEGDYTIRAEVFGQQLGDQPVRRALRVSGDVVNEFDLKATASAPATIEAKLHLKSGTRTVAVAFLNPYTEPRKPGEDAPKKPQPAAQKKADALRPVEPDKHQRVLVVRNIWLDGPYNPPPPVLPETHRRLMAHRPGLSPRDAAREIVTRFAGKAFRRPARPEEVERILKLYDRAEKEGERFENRIRLALEGVLVGPTSCSASSSTLPMRNPERATPSVSTSWPRGCRISSGARCPTTGCSPWRAAGSCGASSKLRCRRMLGDPKSAAFIQNFTGQWLTTRKLAYVAPDPREFPGFDDDLRSSMVRESELFFEAILRENRSILDLLDADFSFVNERLAKHYGIKGVKGPAFRRVKLPPNRGGVLTQAGVLTLTSNPTRTSPVKRGKWVLDQILGTPPPPPPPDVPSLPDDKQMTGSLRQVMEQHRENAVCASCHQRMDPIGFAFENYDAIGAWRDKDGSFAVDPSGVLPNGQAFHGPAELKAILRGKKDQFSRCLTEKVLTYALGRGLEYYDRCAVDEIMQGLARDDYRFSTLILGVIKSAPFQKRTTRGNQS